MLLRLGTNLHCVAIVAVCGNGHIHVYVHLSLTHKQMVIHSPATPSLNESEVSNAPLKRLLLLELHGE